MPTVCAIADNGVQGTNEVCENRVHIVEASENDDDVGARMRVLLG
jgi:hypothetical protein